jgi:hypothetical protein
MVIEKEAADSIVKFRRELGLSKNASLSALLISFAWKDLTFHVFSHPQKFQETILKINASFAERLPVLLAACASQEDFDVLHASLCEEIIQGIGVDENGKAIVSYGMAQKVVNMSFKYLVSSYLVSDADKIAFLHAPVDSYVLRAAKKIGVSLMSDLSNPTKVWSKMTKEQYVGFENRLLIALKGRSRLLWEFGAWKDETHLQKKEVAK